MTEKTMPDDDAREAEDRGSWPAGGAPAAADGSDDEDPRETGPHGEAVHQSDS